MNEMERELMEVGKLGMTMTGDCVVLKLRVTWGRPAGWPNIDITIKLGRPLASDRIRRLEASVRPAPSP